MKFQLPHDVKEEVRRYDPAYRRMIELQEEQAKAEATASRKPRKPRVYKRGNPAGMIPLEMFSDDPDEGLVLYQEMVKEISDDDETTSGHPIFRRDKYGEGLQDVNGDGGNVWMFYFRNLWVAGWIPKREKDGSRPYVYGMSFAYRNNATAQKTVPYRFLRKEKIDYRVPSDADYWFSRDDMVSYKVGRTEYKQKTCYFTEDDIKEGWSREYWHEITSGYDEADCWDFTRFNRRTSSLRHALSHFGDALAYTVRTFKGDHKPFRRLVEGDPSLFKLLRRYQPMRQLLKGTNQNEIDKNEYRNEVDWYIKRFLWHEAADVDKSEEFMNNKQMRRWLTEVCQGIQFRYNQECQMREADFNGLFDQLVRVYDTLMAARCVIRVYPDISVDHLLTMKDAFTNGQELSIPLDVDWATRTTLRQYLQTNVPVTTFVKLYMEEFEEGKRNRQITYQSKVRLGRLPDTLAMIRNILAQGKEVTRPRRWRMDEWHDHVMGLSWKLSNPKQKLPQSLVPEPERVETGLHKWTVLQPRDTHMLAEWGKAVRNCVGNGGYAEMIKEYRAMILLVMVNREPRYTIQCEVRGSELSVTQIASVCNRSPGEAEKEKVSEILEQALSQRQAGLSAEKLDQYRAQLDANLLN